MRSSLPLCIDASRQDLEAAPALGTTSGAPVPLG